MKIVEVNTYTVRPRWGFVEIVTDEGLTGWGAGRPLRHRSGLCPGDEALPHRQGPHAH